jgi:hypothetical protein
VSPIGLAAKTRRRQEERRREEKRSRTMNADKDTIQTEEKTRLTTDRGAE